MAAIDDTAIGIAETYAQALFDLAAAQGQVQAVRGEFDELIEAMTKQPDFASYLTSQAIDSDRRADTLERLFRGRLNDVLLNALLVMNRKGRLALVREVHSAFIRLWEASENRTEATVTTAVPLNEEQRRRIAEALAEQTGKEVILVERVDSEIIGGVVIEIEGKLLDGSVARQLALLERSLHSRARQELLALRQAIHLSGPGAAR